MTTIVTRTGKGSSLSWVEADANFTNLNTDKVENSAIVDMATKTGAETFTNKTINLSNNTLTGTLAQLNAAVSDATLVSLTGMETLTNKNIPESTNTLEFIPNGAGAVATTVQAKLRESVSVKDFGAVGDGVADDTAEIQAWITHISSNGITGFIPSGTYKITSQITSGANSNWGIAGAGSASVEIIYSGANTTQDILVFGDGVSDMKGCLFSGFKIDSTTTMTGGIGIHFKRLCRSTVYDVIAAGQDGSGNLWNGVRFNGLDNVYYDGFEIRAQKDGLQVNGLTGSNPKADLILSNYKIGLCDVGIRYGGAYGGGAVGNGSVVVCGDGVVIDNTLVAEANREIFFSPDTVIDANTRSGIIIDQAISGSMRINIPGRMWCASSASHAVWIKNANNAYIDINAYIYNVTGDGIRIDDANAIVSIDSMFANMMTVGTYSINETVATTGVKLGSGCRFENVLNPFSYSLNRAITNIPLPMSIQGGRSFYTDTFTGTLNASGNALVAHGKGGAYYKKAIAVFASAKTTGGAWNQLTTAYIDGSNISITGSVGLASQPYNVMVMVGDEANSGW